MRTNHFQPNGNLQRDFACYLQNTCVITLLTRLTSDLGSVFCPRRAIRPPSIDMSSYELPTVKIKTPIRRDCHSRESSIYRSMGTITPSIKRHLLLLLFYYLFCSLFSRCFLRSGIFPRENEARLRIAAHS